MCMRCLALSRRSLLAGGGVAAAAMATGVAQARVRPQDMVPLVGPGYRPTEKDEKGMWQLMERVEEEVAGSNLLINDPSSPATFGTSSARSADPRQRTCASIWRTFPTSTR